MKNIKDYNDVLSSATKILCAINDERRHFGLGALTDRQCEALIYESLTERTELVLDPAELSTKAFLKL